MFSFFKKHQKPLFEGLCDIHNHLLPGIDDGSKDLETSAKMLHAFEGLGFTSTIPTPHIYKELYPNTPETIKNAYDLLKQQKEVESSVRVNSYAAEYMVDEVFMKNLEQSSPLLLLNGTYILLEINFFGKTTMLKSACFSLFQKNITPILAHPERYHLIKDISEYQNLKNQGFYFQLNALSLMGQYGPEVKQKAEKLLKEGLYDFVATDAHSVNDLKKLKNLSLSKKQGIQWESIREFQLKLFSS
jgi:protein-tyrosine phosphatase